MSITNIPLLDDPKLWRRARALKYLVAAAVAIGAAWAAFGGPIPATRYYVDGEVAKLASPIQAMSVDIINIGINQIDAALKEPGALSPARAALLEGQKRELEQRLKRLTERR